MRTAVGALLVALLGVSACAEDSNASASTDGGGAADSVLQPVPPVTDGANGSDATPDEKPDVDASDPTDASEDATPVSDATTDGADAELKTDATPDTAPGDVAPDGLEDGGANGDADAGTPDANGPPGEALFRVTSLGVASPALCYDLSGDGTCSPLNGVINLLLQSQIESDEEPVHFLGHFSTFVFPSDEHTLAFGVGECTAAAGGFEDCTIPDPQVFSPIYLKEVGVCALEPLVEAPCVLTAEKDTLALTVFDIPLVFHDAHILGGFSGAYSAIEGGKISGLVTLEQAKTLGINVGLTDYVPLFDLLTQTPMETTPEGLTGWTFTLEFVAQALATGGP